jgi:hypothetical protein
MRYVAGICAAAAALALLGACGPRTAPGKNGASANAPNLHEAVSPARQDAPAFHFVDITRKAGILWQRANGAFGRKMIPETTGGGGAFIDYDNDGWHDIVLVNGDWYAGHPLPGPRPTLALYHNNRDGTFTDVTEQMGLKVSLQGMGVAVGDYDNDGYDDLLITGVGGNHLFHNESKVESRKSKVERALNAQRPRRSRTDERQAQPMQSPNARIFHDVTKQAGVGGSGWSTSAAWLDYDNDGLLDLFVCHYVRWTPETDLFCGSQFKTYCTPTYYHGESCRLYHNDGGGHFSDVTKKAGIFNDNAKGLGVCTVDFDHDGRMDILVSNDTEPNYAFRNNGNGTFTEMGITCGLALGEDGHPRAGMGIDAADYKNDGKLAVMVGDFSFQGTGFFREAQPGLYIDDARQTGILKASYPYVTFGVMFCDLDNDGWQDVLLSNGHVDDLIERSSPVQHYMQPTLVLANRRDGTFADVSARSGPGLAQPLPGRGAVWGDPDNDGRPDVLLIPNIGPPRLLHNETPKTGHWLMLKLSGAPGRTNRDGYGAVVRVTAGGLTLTNTARSGSGFCSQSDRRLHFGLGASDRADTLEVRWPDGKTDVWKNVEADKRWLLAEGKPPVPLP